MEGDQQYSCSSKDANSRLSHETIAQVPKKRQEMVLSLSKTSLATSDQTPTPTTFIRNCEEVGLFQDLRNVNPFEETFRKAAEAVRTGTIPPPALSFSSHGGDDTLHTPHVFPTIVETLLEASEKTSGICLQSSENKNQTARERVVRSEADTSLKISSPASHQQNEVIVELDSPPPVRKNGRARNQEVNRRKNNRNHKVIQPQDQNKEPEQKVQVLLKMPDGTLLQISTKPVDQANVGQVTGQTPLAPNTGTNNTVILNTQTFTATQHSPQDNTSLVKQKLKQALLSGLKPAKPISKVPPININSAVSLSSSGNSAAEKMKREEAALIRRASSSTNSEEDSTDVKRRRALERNRAAAMRCRERRKAWVDDLRKRAELMMSTNQTLLQEVAFLRSEVARLKALLLTHRNCPVTLAAIANGGNGDTGTGMNDDGVTSKGPVTMVISDKKAMEPRREEVVTTHNNVTPLCGMGVGGKGSRMRERLSLDIEGARRAQPRQNPVVIELDSPLVISDEVLSSVAPTTPSEAEKLVAFPDEHMDIDSSDGSDIGVLDERPMQTAGTPVIQVNPNALLRGSSASTVSTITSQRGTKYR